MKLWFRWAKNVFLYLLTSYNLPCLQELTFRSPEGRQTPLGVQNPWLSGFRVWFKNTFGGTAYLIKSMPFKVTGFWYTVYIDLQQSDISDINSWFSWVFTLNSTKIFFHVHVLSFLCYKMYKTKFNLSEKGISNNC